MQGALRAPLTAAILAGAVLFAGASFMSWPAAASTLALSTQAPWALPFTTGTMHWVHDAYTKAPALVIGLFALVLIPPLAIAGLMLRWFVSPRRQDASGGLERTRELVGCVPDTASASAFFEWDGGSDGLRRQPIDRQLLQIGRHDDNDICIDERTVHRYHAIIERNREQGLVILDISGPEGNGVKLNGMRIQRARLSDGDMVELGAARFKVVFEQEGTSTPQAAGEFG